jgi:AcrR family transcriptional regulator
VDEPVKPRRAYRSPRRREQAEQTRQRIVEAAARRFVERGYAGTTISAVAEDAGVAAETVYATFRTKAELLRAVVGAAARGPGETPILEQPGPAAVAAERDQREQLRRFAADVTARLARTAPVLAVLQAAAPGEPALAEVYADLHAARRRNLERLVEQLEANGPLALDGDAALRTVWALASPELYALATGAGGWTRETYEAWLAERLADALLPGDPR